jgi:hypothetical protein
MLRSVALVRMDISEELSASFNRVTGIGELEILVVISNRQTHSLDRIPLTTFRNNRLSPLQSTISV